MPAISLPLACRTTTTCLLVLALLLFAACGESPEARYQRLLATGHDQLAAGDYRQALSAWQEILTFTEPTPDIFQRIGDCYYHLALYPHALQAYQEALKLAPADPAIRPAILTIQLITKDLAGAETTLNGIAPQHRQGETAILHGDLLFLGKKYDEAAAAYQKCIAADQQNGTARIRLTLVLFAQQKKGEAAAVFQPLRDAAPDNGELLLQMGLYCSLLGETDQARSYFHRAITLHPRDLHLRFQLVDFLISTGQLDESITVLQEIVKIEPDNSFARKLLIETFLHGNRLAEARAVLDTFARETVKDLELLLLKGKYFLLNNEYHAALSQFQTILEHEPKQPLAHYFLALAYLAGGQSKLGEKSLIQALSLNPDFTDAELTLASVHYKSGNHDLALEHAERIRKREPHNYRACLITGNIRLARRQYPEAMAAFHAAGLLNPGIASPAYYQALTASLAGDREDALRRFKSLLDEHPELIDAALHYTRILATGGQAAIAIGWLNETEAALDPTYHNHLLGEILVVAKKRQEAITAFQQAITAAPGLKSSYRHLFDLLADNRQQLEETLKKAINDHKDFDEAYARLADLYCGNNDPGRAIALLEDAVAAAPQSAQLANNLAWLYVEHQPEDIDEAMRLAQLAYEKTPANPAFADTLGRIYARKNMAGRAVWLLEQAYAAEPDNALVNFHLGFVLHQQNASDKARKYLLFAVENGRDHPFQEVARKLLLLDDKQ